MAASKKAKTQKPKSKKASASKKPPQKLSGKKASAKKVSGQKVSGQKVSGKKPTSKNSNVKKSVSKVKPAGAMKSKAKKAPSKSVPSTQAKPSSVSYAKFFNPLDDRIVVDILPAPTKTAGGLFIPDSGQEKPERGVVVAVGPGKRNKKAQLRPLDVKIGDEVIFAKYAGTAIEILGKEVFILREDEVLGIVN